jgi:hypothetical protein
MSALNSLRFSLFIESNIRPGNFTAVTMTKKGAEQERPVTLQKSTLPLGDSGFSFSYIRLTDASDGQSLHHVRLLIGYVLMIQLRSLPQPAGRPILQQTAWRWDYV